MTERPTLKKQNPGVNKDLMAKYQQIVHYLKNEVTTMEINIKKLNAIIDKLIAFNPEDETSLDINKEVQDALNTANLNNYEEDNCEVIEGLFDGYFMIGADQKKYPVPMNYSSKTKLIP